MSTSHDTTHCIYRIVCTASGKVYIGQTINPRMRKKAHFGDLRANRHVNSFLQRAFNTHGEGTFYFEVLEKDLSSAEVNVREVEWIRHFNSYHNGYNMTEGGESAVTNGSKPCTWNGITYPSIREAARALGIDKTGMSRRLAKGYTCDADLKHTFSITPCEWNGVQYPSVSTAAQALGINRVTMLWRVEKGYRQDSDIPRNNERRKVTWNGIEYVSVGEAAAACGISRGRMSVRLKMGYVCDADLDTDYRKRSQLKGSAHYNAKVDDSVVECIRQRYAEGGITMAQLGEQVGLSAQYVCRIINRQSRA